MNPNCLSCKPKLLNLMKNRGQRLSKESPRSAHSEIAMRTKAGDLRESSGRALADLKAGIDEATKKLKESVDQTKSNFAKK